MISILVHSSEHSEWMNLNIHLNGFGTSHATLFNVEWWCDEDDTEVRGYFPCYINICRGDVLHYCDGELNLVPDPGLWASNINGEWSNP